MKRILVVSLLAITLVLPGIASANFIVNGDFIGLSAGSFTSFSDFSGSTGPFGQWLGQTNTWAISTSGGPDGSAYAGQLYNSSRLYQGFDASSIASGTSMNISFDYIYQSGYTGEASQVWVYGFTSTEAMSANAPWNFTGTPDVLYQAAININSTWVSLSDSFTVSDNYSALLFMVGMGADGLPALGLRGIDKINIDGASVPEPSTMLLLGSGLVGLVGYGRRRFKK